MAYDEDLLNRLTKILSKTHQIEQKKMFGGVCIMLNGNMLCGVESNRLMLRVGPDKYQYALSLKHAVKMDFTGKPLKGFIFVKPAGYKSEKDLRKWLELGLKFVSSLPAKKKASQNYPDSTPLKKVKNFGPVTSGELTSIGFNNIGQIRQLGFEETCRKWVQYYPERLNTNAFLGIICSIENTVWTKATAEHRKAAHSLAKMLRAEFGINPVGRHR
jgi:TfoX/Sxy family transcriptional regulator of competence genes